MVIAEMIFGEELQSMGIVSGSLLIPGAHINELGLVVIVLQSFRMVLTKHHTSHILPNVW